MRRLVVSLPMYAVPAEGLAAFWQGLRGHLVKQGFTGVPALPDTPDELLAHWLDPDLLFSQTCGYPLTTTLAGRVRYVGTPCYRAPGCHGVAYRSHIVVRADDPAQGLADLAGRRVAYNGVDSQSGMNALRALVAPLAREGRFFGAAIETGSHRASVAAVKEGRADLAAIDAVTFALLSRDTPGAVYGLRTLGFTDPAPGLPIITALSTGSDEIARLRAAWSAACADPELAASRAALLLDGFEVLPASDYDVIASMQDAALALGYPALA